MPDFYEIDFLPVHTSKSGDAIAMRYQIGANWWVHVVDGGFTSTAPDLANLIRQTYGTHVINFMVVTHPDKDHAEGLAPILESFDVGELWMLRPWEYAEILLPHFARYSSAESLAKRLREEYPYIAKLERIAVSRNIPIHRPFQGERFGAFTVFAPSPARYLQLIIQSDKTPQTTADWNYFRPISWVLSREVGMGGNHETDRHSGADGRHVHRLDGERNLGFALWRLQFVAACWRVHRSRLNRGSG